MDEKPCKHRIVSFLSTGLCTTNFRLTVNCYSLLLLVCDKVLNSGALINYNFTRNLIQFSLLQKKLGQIFLCMALAKFALIYFSLPFLSTHYQTIICSAQTVTKKNKSAHFQYFTTPYLQVGLKNGLQNEGLKTKRLHPSLIDNAPLMTLQ